MLSIIIARLMSDLWVGDKRVREWILPRRTAETEDTDGVQEMACGHFQQKYDRVQGMIQQIGCMDELLSGGFYKHCMHSPILILFILS